MIANIIMLCLGLAIGGVAVWLVLKAKIQSAGEAERAVLAERLQSKDLQIATLTDSLKNSGIENNRLQLEVTAESSKRAAAEAVNYPADCHCSALVLATLTSFSRPSDCRCRTQTLNFHLMRGLVPCVGG